MTSKINFEPARLAKFFDHTILRPEATDQAVRKLCAEARAGAFMAVCVHAVHLPIVVRELEGSGVLPITVVGFPLGAVPSSVKCEETRLAIGLGAREIDMVIHVGAWLSGRGREVRDDIEAVVRASGQIPVKVIIETSLLTGDQIREITGTVIDAGAAFVKTSTGFGARGASVEDIQIMKSVVTQRRASLGIKASGGIKTLAQAFALIEAGATRIGSSVSPAILAELGAK